MLKLGLKHGVFIRTKEDKMIAVMEDQIYEQIVHQDLLKKDNISKRCVQTALKSRTYSHLDLDVKNFTVHQRRIKVLHSLREVWY